MLGLLDGLGPTTGADLARAAADTIGDFWTVTRSQVYRELTSLAEQGLVKAGATGARDARPFSITRAGRAAFRRWLAQGPGDSTVRIPLLLTLAFAEHVPPDRLAEILTDAAREHRERLDGYHALESELVAAEVPLAQWATLRFGIRYEEAMLAWLADLRPPERKRVGRVDAD